jgi:sigma-B regulation protein RsbU (phosphoserine phosphatase)
MRRTLALRTAAFVVLAALAAFQLIGLTVALISATRPRVTDFGFTGAGLGGHSDLVRLRAYGGFPIDSVWGPALEAGLRRGDVVTNIDGVRMTDRPRVWYAGRFTTPPGDTLHLTVRREDRTFEAALVTRRLSEPLRWGVGPNVYMDYRTAHWLNWGPDLLLSLLMFAVGLVIGAFRRRDPIAWTFALVFLGISLGTSITSRTPLLHVWPPWLTLVWGLSVIAGAGYAVPLGIMGLMRFPVPTRVSRGLWPWRWVPFVVFGPPTLAAMGVLMAADSGRFTTASLARISYVADHGFNFALASGFAVMGTLLVAHRFERGAAGKARLKTLWYGAMGAVVGGLWAVMIPKTFWYWLTQPLGPAPGAWLGKFLADIAPTLLVCLTPLSFAYAILSRRLFGIRLVLRRGLQHLLLSRAVLAVEGVLLFLVLEQSIRSGTVVAGVRGPALAGGLALLVVSGIAVVNRPLMLALDRRFFRDRYDARRVMLGLAQELARLGERDEIVRRIGAAIVASLHPARAAIFIARDGTALEAAWRSDPDAAAGAVERARETAELAARLSPDESREWIAIPPPEIDEPLGGMGDFPVAGPPVDEPPPPVLSPYEVVIPLRQSRRLSGCIALSAKLSEEPYTSEDRELLITVAHQAALALENADLLAVARREAQLAREVEIARDVQRNLFPRALPQVAGWEVAAICRPARAVAGDYYDVMLAQDGALGLALGDVSGKGVGASLLSAGLHAMVRSRLPGATCDLARLLEDLNAHLIGSSADEMFATLVVARIDPASGQVSYVNAGHPPPVVVTANGARWLDEGGPLAGVMPKARYQPGEIHMAPGDLLAVYSDGVTEAERPGGGELFGDQRLFEALRCARGGSAGDALAALLAAVDAYAGPGEPADDISVIVVRRLP